jgi:hypothetical protein
VDQKVISKAVEEFMVNFQLLFLLVEACAEAVIRKTSILRPVNSG